MASQSILQLLQALRTSILNPEQGELSLQQNVVRHTSNKLPIDAYNKILGPNMSLKEDLGVYPKKHDLLKVSTKKRKLTDDKSIFHGKVVSHTFQ